VKVRPELVAFGYPDEIKVDKNGVIGGGKHLRPAQVDELVAQRGDDVVFFDGRNAFEAQVGRFKNAVVPDTVTTRDFVSEIESGKYDHLKDKPIVTYCTGGIRCEVLSSVMKTRGFKEVYQIDGGIVSYGKSLVMTVCGKARSSHLMTEYQLSSAKKVNQLQSVRSVQHQLIVFTIAQRCHVTQLTYCVRNVLKK
jgi:predicted sulfurtransferase